MRQVQELILEMYLDIHFYRRLAHAEARQRHRKMLWMGGGFLPGHLGVSVQWQLGPEGGAGRVQAAGVWPGSVCPTGHPHQPWHWEDSPGQYALQR